MADVEMNPSVAEVRAYLEVFQDRVCEAIEAAEGGEQFRREEIEREGGGHSRPRVLEDGEVIERAAVNLTYSAGERLPKAATERRPELAGERYEAVSVSLIVHPRNPYAPTSHANFRYFQPSTDVEPIWWFGGGFDLTPYYGFEDDAVHWHRTARDACTPFGADLYERCKQACDQYFYLPHRGEPRGIGGLFFDDYNDGGFDSAFAFVRSASEAYLDAYFPILNRRAKTHYGERERQFQLYRRGRYVEFNLLQDRGTRFGLEAGARTESLLASMPPLVRWEYDYEPEPGSDEAKLTTDFLRPRDWLG